LVIAGKAKVYKIFSKKKIYKREEIFGKSTRLLKENFKILLEIIKENCNWIELA
jgi:hypothetical protein